MLLGSTAAPAAGARLTGKLLGYAASDAGAGWLSWLQNKLMWIVCLWALCAAALGVRMALGLLWIGRVAQGRRTDAHWQAHVSRLAAQFGVTRAVRLRIVDNLASPITAGWWRPVVLVPASLVSGMSPHLLEALLAHEMAHVKRFDYLVNLGQNVVETLLFYHPAVWWISGRIRAEREQIADDVAARQLGEPRRLALALSELERFQFSTHHLAQAANGGDLMSRIKRLVRPDTQALNWKAAIPVLGLAGTLLAGCANAPSATSATSHASGAEHTRAIADFASCAKPQYPKDDIAARHTGTVSMGFLVTAEGTVADSKIVKSSGYRGLDEAAINSLNKCSFKPATLAGKPVQEWTHVMYVWTLD
jgi:D-alanyl-D-alanine endopeptidase (penicillin-binding protein 7)